MLVVLPVGCAEWDPDDRQPVSVEHGVGHTAVLLLVVYHVDLIAHRQVSNTATANRDLKTHTSELCQKLICYCSVEK